MDHQPIISNPAKLPFEVPFLEDPQFKYDGKGAADFPGRIGCLLVPTDVPLDMKALALFQSWLFFRTLTDVLSLYQIPVAYDDFKMMSHGRSLLTTKNLQGYLAAWVVSASRESKWCLRKSPPFGKVAVPPSGRPQDLEEHSRVTPEKAGVLCGIFDSISTTLYHLSLREYGIHSTVWDSVLILCSTLHNTARFIYRAYDINFGSLGLFGEIPTRALRELFRRTQWCPREVEVVKHLLDGDPGMLLLCSQLDRHLEDVSHSSCTERLCSAYQTTEATYETKHVENGCGCVFINVGNIYHHGLLTSQKSWLPLRLQQIPLITFVDDRLVVIHMSPLRADI